MTQATIAPKNTARLNLRQISGPVVKIVPHVHEPAGGLCDAFRRHGISGGGATVSVCRPADRRAWPVPDSRGTSQRPTRRFRGNESSDARGPRVLPSGDLLQSPAVGIEVWQAPPTHHRIPRAPRAWRHRAPSACQRVESSLWARRVSIPGKDETSARRPSAIQHPNLRAAQNRAGVFGQFVLESHERWCSPHAVRFRRGAARSLRRAVNPESSP